ncbi:Copper amine oxidase-like, N-terminal [Syntrophomonas zehnderi OL-4]|uniref:Copper amine oxidase-like, N-terminal n=1 Tax=Syntrophomonas zehnderi OL-4 TaxID=690567 RepID=A0A0E4GAN9_9FIRM|nr:copper amine oxidase N-terminal domain-containing protein [Syntrophomonas zehnderi]CFX62124.1 Copper amine oxidase-like, N-terminal [Syntrophomonas zehnderi OL-4]
MKKRCAILLCLAMVMAMLAVPVLAAETGPSVVIDGQAVTFTDAAPIIEDSRTLVPLRAIFEKMGAKVEWNQDTQTAIAVKADIKVVIKIGSLEPTINGEVKKIDVPAKIVNNRTLAPMRFVCEAFGGKVTWDDATKTASVTSPAPPADKPADPGTPAAPTTAADLAKAVVANFAPVKVKTNLTGTVAGIVQVGGQAESTIDAAGVASSTIQGDSGPLGKSTSTVAVCPYSEIIYGPEAEALKLLANATMKDTVLSVSGNLPTSLINFLNGVNKDVKWSNVTGDVSITVDKTTKQVSKIIVKNGKAKVATPLGDKEAVFEATFEYAY